MFRLAQLWRTTTVRLTALFMLIFVVFAIGLLALISWQTSTQLQQQQADAIDRETAQLVRIDSGAGFRATIVAVERLSRQPGPGLYYLADPSGQMIVGNIDDLPPETDEVLLRRVAPTPLRHVMRLLNDVEACAAEVFETEPDRWQRLLEIHHASSEA